MTNINKGTKGRVCSREIGSAVAIAVLTWGSVAWGAASTAETQRNACSGKAVYTKACAAHRKAHLKKGKPLTAAQRKEFQQQVAQLNKLSTQFVADLTALREAQQPRVAQTGRGLANVSLASPNALGGAGTSVFAALNYENHWDGTTQQDGAFITGASFGNPYKYIGASVTVDVDSLGFNNDAFAANGGLGFRLNRYITRTTALAVGAGAPVGWGAIHDLSASYYGVITQVIPCRFPITINFGTGTGAFYSTASAQADRDNQFGIFGGVGVTVYRGLSLVVDDASRELNTGATYIFNYKKASFFLTAAGMNVASYQGFQPHFMATGGLSYQLSS